MFEHQSKNTAKIENQLGFERDFLAKRKRIYQSKEIFIRIMEKEPRVDNDSIEHGKPGIKLSYQYKDMYGRIFGSFESKKLYPLPDPSSSEATYFDGSVETPYGNFMLECKIPEAKKTLALIADFVREKEGLADLEKQLNQARNRLNIAREKYRQGGEPDYEAYHLVDDLQRRELQLEAKLKVHKEWLKEYKI